MRGLMWFKKDLRLSDNPALSEACQDCEDGVIAVYLIDKDLWKRNDTSLHQIEFILSSLPKLYQALQKANIPLIIQEVTSTQAIPNVLQKLCNQHHIKKLYFNVEYEVNESRRDTAVTQYLEKHGLEVEAYQDQLILPYKKVKTGSDTYFKIFTAFKRQWLKVYEEYAPLKILPKPKSKVQITLPSPHFLSVKENANWPSGEDEALKRLNVSTKKCLYHYEEERNFPALDSTSRISPYLATGMISPRTCFMAAVNANNGKVLAGNSNVLTWMSELIWREFYRHIVIYVPRVCMRKAYQLATEKLPWQYNETHFNAWKEGKTGFPIVDAAMRQLNKTGWMHNRLRMVAAMFLSKILMLDWRLGEKYFSETLIDIDFASNNGGWQWSASTGTDAVPYFRVFNPMLQAQRFDADAHFIREFCPELQGISAKSIHNLDLLKSIYLVPIVDYKTCRTRVINAFKNLR